MEVLTLPIIGGVVCMLLLWVGLSVYRLVRQRQAIKEYESLDGDQFDFFIRELTLLEAYEQLDPATPAVLREVHAEAVRARATRLAKELIGHSNSRTRTTVLKRLRRMGFDVAIIGSFDTPEPVEFIISNTNLSISGRYSPQELAEAT